MAHPHLKKKVTDGKTRLNLRLPARLIRWVKVFAKEHNTTVTQLIVDHLTELKKRAETEDVPQV